MKTKIRLRLLLMFPFSLWSMVTGSHSIHQEIQSRRIWKKFSPQLQSLGFPGVNINFNWLTCRRGLIYSRILRVIYFFTALFPTYPPSLPLYHPANMCLQYCPYAGIYGYSPYLIADGIFGHGGVNSEITRLATLNRFRHWTPRNSTRWCWNWRWPRNWRSLSYSRFKVFDIWYRVGLAGQ